MPKIVKKETNVKAVNSVPVTMRTLNNCVKESLIDDNVKAFRNTQDKLIEIYAKKNHDYGDCFNEACDELGVGYAFSRIYDKTKRFQTLAKSIMNNSASVEIKEETIEDTIMDLANYCMMYLTWKDAYKRTINPLKGSDYGVDNHVYIDIKTNLDNEVVKLVHEGTDAPCTSNVLFNYGNQLVKDNNNYVYIENKDGSFTPVTDGGCLVKVAPK